MRDSNWDVVGMKSACGNFVLQSGRYLYVRNGSGLYDRARDVTPKARTAFGNVELHVWSDATETWSPVEPPPSLFGYFFLLFATSAAAYWIAYIAAGSAVFAGCASAAVLLACVAVDAWRSKP